MSKTKKTRPTGRGRFRVPKRSFRETMESAVQRLDARMGRVEDVAREARTRRPLGFKPVSTLNAGPGARWEDRGEHERPRPTNGLGFTVHSTLDAGPGAPFDSRR